MGAVDDITNREVVLVMLQYSVVAKGLEHKLQEMEYRVTTVASNFEEEVKRYASGIALFILYLPSDIVEDTPKRMLLEHLVGLLKGRDQKILLIGESKFHVDLTILHPVLKSYAWIDRPVDMTQFQTAVDKVIKAKTDIGRRKRILIVDDDPAYAKMVREWIKDDFKVDIVTAGMQAITFLLRVPEDDMVDLILLDYEMPVVDGPQVLQMLRQEKVTKDIPVIFLTGLGTKEAVSRVMSLKPDGYVLKSTTKDDLLGYLNEKLIKVKV